MFRAYSGLNEGIVLLSYIQTLTSMHVVLTTCIVNTLLLIKFGIYTFTPLF